MFARMVIVSRIVKCLIASEFLNQCDGSWGRKFPTINDGLEGEAWNVSVAGFDTKQRYRE